jgi:hypothetical protein
MQAFEFVNADNFISADKIDLLDISTLYLLAAPCTPPKVRDELIERLDRGEKLTPAEVAKYVKEEKGPIEPPREMLLVTRPATPPEPVDPLRGSWTAAQLLRSSLLDIERMLGDLDGVPETLMETDAAISRTLFRKIGAALSAVGNTFEGTAKPCSRSPTNTSNRKNRSSTKRLFRRNPGN